VNDETVSRQIARNYKTVTVITTEDMG